MKRSLAFAALALLAGLGVQAAPSGCVACHASDAAIKALFVPPLAMPTTDGG